MKQFVIIFVASVFYFFLGAELHKFVDARYGTGTSCLFSLLIIMLPVAFIISLIQGVPLWEKKK